MCKSLQTTDGYNKWFTRFKNQHRVVLEFLLQELNAPAILTHPSKIGRATCADLAQGLLSWVC